MILSEQTGEAYHLKNKRDCATYTNGFTETQLQILWMRIKRQWQT